MPRTNYRMGQRRDIAAQDPTLQEDLFQLSDVAKQQRREAVAENTQANLERVIDGDLPPRSIGEVESLRAMRQAGVDTSDREVRALQRRIADKRFELSELQRKGVPQEQYLEAARQANRSIDVWRRQIAELQGQVEEVPAYEPAPDDLDAAAEAGGAVEGARAGARAGGRPGGTAEVRAAEAALMRARRGR
jgi:hypothetical protein